MSRTLRIILTNGSLLRWCLLSNAKGNLYTYETFVILILWFGILYMQTVYWEWCLWRSYKRKIVSSQTVVQDLIFVLFYTTTFEITLCSPCRYSWAKFYQKDNELPWSPDRVWCKPCSWVYHYHSIFKCW